jgi:ATP-dependent Lhr-like helicase
VVTTIRTSRAGPGPPPLPLPGPPTPSLVAPGEGGSSDDPVLSTLHPAVAGWFHRRFPAGPTEPQRAAWPHILAGADVLVASPTGTGKTLTGFLMAIDAAYRSHADALLDGTGPAPGSALGPGVVYVSPLRALATDVHENLQVPLAGIAEEAARLGVRRPDCRSPCAPATPRPPSGRPCAGRRPTARHHARVPVPAPHRGLVPGSCCRVHTVIIDEVHTLARDKRGSHLALTLERLDGLVSAGGHLQRIGLSATQRPLEVVARLLSGAACRPSVPPPSSTAATPASSTWPSSSRRASSRRWPAARSSRTSSTASPTHVLEHRTTLVFVNTRKMAERVAHQLAAGAPDEDGAPEGTTTAESADTVDAALQVAAHHGSLSAARRRIVEQRLRAGDLRALVATASLELGIDVGPVELVCQIGSPRAIGTFLQRVGRANHQREGIPAGRLYPLTRDELVECTALLAAVRAGHLDVLEPPVAPLDVLAQQLVAEVAAAEEWGSTSSGRPGPPGRPRTPTSPRDFDEVVALVSWGIRHGRGRRGAHLHHDAVNGRLRARRGARLAALTSGGAIPETGDYRVVLDPDGVTVGSVHEDFAVEAMAGDIFLLGTHSWRVVKVETGTVRVVDAGDLPPTIPFWLGEAPARTAELSEEVGSLRADLEPLLAAGDGEEARRAWSVAGPASQRRWPTRWWPTSVPDWLRSGRSPPGTASSSSGSSTTAREPSSSSTRPTVAASTGRSGWLCASASACRSTSSSRRRPTTTP